MYRVLFRIGVLAATVVAGGMAWTAASATGSAAHTQAATQVTDEDFCFIIDGVLYCFTGLDADQRSTTSVPDKA